MPRLEEESKLIWRTIPPGFSKPSTLQRETEGVTNRETVPNSATDNFLVHRQLAQCEDAPRVPSQHKVLNPLDFKRDGDGVDLDLSDSLAGERADKKLGEVEGIDFDGGGDASLSC